jgi:hypothetical protein
MWGGWNTGKGERWIARIAKTKFEAGLSLMNQYRSDAWAMKLLLINQIENDRRLIDLSSLSRELSKSTSGITFRDIASRTVRDTRAWHLHCLADGNKLEILPENGRAADFGYPQTLFWVRVQEAPAAREAPPERHYEVRHRGYYQLGIRIATFMEFLGLSFDIFRSRAGKTFWILSFVFILAGAGLAKYTGDYRLAIPWILIIPFVYSIRASLTAMFLMREVWPQVQSWLR